MGPAGWGEDSQLPALSSGTLVSAPCVPSPRCRAPWPRTVLVLSCRGLPRRPRSSTCLQWPDGWRGVDRFCPSALSREWLTLAPGPSSGFTVVPVVVTQRTRGWASCSGTRVPSEGHAEAGGPHALPWPGGRQEAVFTLHDNGSAAAPQEANAWGPHPSSCWF